jgi:hypothetical protein
MLNGGQTPFTEISSVNHDKMPCGLAINNLLINFDNTEFSMYLKFDNRLKNSLKGSSLR